MKKSNPLLFNNSKSIEFSNPYDWKIHASSSFRGILEIDSLSTSSEFLSRSAYQFIDNLIIYTSGFSSFSVKIDKGYDGIIDFIIPCEGGIKIKSKGKMFDASADYSVFTHHHMRQFENVHESGLAVFLQTNASTLERVIRAENAISSTQNSYSLNFSESLIELNEGNIHLQRALIKTLGIIDALDGDENLLSSIGFDDVIYRLMLNLMGDGIINSNDAAINLSNRSDRSVDILCDAIRQFSGKVMTITEMQEITGLSGRSLQYAFNRRFGCTPREWQRNEHLIKARELLLDSNNNQTIKDISQQLGFTSAASFSRFYLKRFGELPTVTFKKK